MINLIKRKAFAIAETVAIAVVILQIILPMWLDLILGLFLVGMFYGVSRVQKDK